MRKVRNGINSLLLATESRFLGQVMVFLAGIFVVQNRLPQWFRRIVDLAQPQDPLGRLSTGLPEIDIVTFTAEDTLQFAETAIVSARKSSRNPVRAIYAVVPARIVEEAKRKIPSATVVTDDEVMPARIRMAALKYVGVGRENWVIRQIIGLYFVKNSDARGVLMVDSDTYLLGERTWLVDSKKQLLSFSTEYHLPYESHCLALYGQRKRHRGLSYITHFMFMQPWVVREIFPDDEALVRWAESGDAAEKSAVADYHTYGRWLVENHPRSVVMERWHNKGFVWDFSGDSSAEQVIEELRRRFKKCGSVSSHRYIEINMNSDPSPH